MSGSESTDVVAAVIEREGSFLVTRRLEGTHLAGYWEFPGGKRDGAEGLEDALRREIREELGAEVTVGPLLLVSEYRHSGSPMNLHFFECAPEGEAKPLLGQQIQWARAGDLGNLRFPPADAEIVRLLLTRPRK